MPELDRVHDLLGQDRYTGAEQGARAYIDRQYLGYCFASGVAANDRDRGTSAWVSVTGPATSGRNIVQMGNVRCLGLGIGYCDGSLNRVFAWGRDNNTPGCEGMQDVDPIGVDAGPAESSGGPLRYTVVHAGGLWNGYVGALREAYVLESRICWTPDDVKFFTETKDLGDGHGGWDTDRLHFADTQALGTEGGSWTTLNLGSQCSTYAPVLNPDIYKCRIDADDPNDMSIWTTNP